MWGRSSFVAARLVQAAGRRCFSGGSVSGGGDNKRAAGIMGTSWSPMAQLSDKLSKKLANMGAKEKIEKEAEKGDAKAMLLMGAMHSMGRLVEQNDVEAVKWFSQAADQGSGEGHLAMAVMTMQGIGGLEMDKTKAVQHLEEASKKDVAQAQGELGRLLYSGSDGVAEDLGRAIKLLEKASEQGYLRASYNLAVLIAEGKGAPKYPPKSKAATSKSHELIRLAADKGLPDAQHALSTWYERGSDAVKQDPRKAAQWGRKAAEGGYIGAMHNLGLRLEFGQGGERVNVGEAISWFAKAAAAGELESYVALGNAYLARDGQGDKEAAFDAFRKAAQGGHSIAMFNTAVCHDAAIGTAQDHEAAFKWLKKSAEGGNAVAMWQLGEAMSVGRGCQVDDVQAREWYDRAKAAGLDAPPTQ